jgi:hypothetical protein
MPDNAVKQFKFKGKFLKLEPIGNGHINSTFAVYFEKEDLSVEKYILQSINTNVFKNTKELMSNIDNVTSHIKEKIKQEGGNPKRETINIIKTIDDKLYYEESKEICWRAYRYIENATSHDLVEKPVMFRYAAQAFGKFQKQLSDFDANNLYEVIPMFHDTQNRFKIFLQSVKDDKAGRLKNVRSEVEFVMERENDCKVIVEKIQSGEIPIRVTHNDTKLNNIMIDNETDKGVCVIDLDTVMPGSALYDFGDAIRFGANTAQEDETDLDKVDIDLDLFKEFAKGFLGEASEVLTQTEIDLLAFSAKLITLELGMRFLTDYLDGDNYFKIHREHHNLDRARNQFKLVERIEKNLDLMNEIVKKYADRYHLKNENLIYISKYARDRKVFCNMQIGYPAALINISKWDYDFTPKSSAIVAHNDEKIFIKMISNEEDIIAAQTEQNSNVCTDSCLEFFFAPVFKDDEYFNFEVNPIGTMHIGFGKGRSDRLLITDEDKRYFQMQSGTLQDGNGVRWWFVDFVIPFEFLSKYKKNFKYKKGFKARCNFYKCGDLTKRKHYLTWAEVKTENPDFHRPEFFAPIIFE